MIQRSASFDRVCALLLLLPLGGACGGGTAHKVARTLAGTTSRSAFVPPYAYEAYVRGELLLLQGRPAEAVTQLELAVTAPDEDPYLLSRLAFAQLESGDRAEAARTVEHASELDRCSEAVWLMRGTLAESTQELTVARAAYEKASACAPSSPRGQLALVQLLMRHGEQASAIQLLLEPAVRAEGSLPAVHNALRSALESADPATLAHALDSLSKERAVDSFTLEQAVGLALDRGLPRLALRLSEQHRAALPVALEARLLSANGLCDRLAVLIASHDSDALGGHERTAELALEAHAYERAELEASTALALQESDALHALRARAVLALGRTHAALLDVRAVQEAGLRRSLVLEALAAAGAPGLARETAGTHAR
ncbi:MAG: domain protein putative component of TonB system [Myxococcaceae bacterium]|nr:domain protein putative component of TonB system [Myxococcaceae bacterium]